MGIIRRHGGSKLLFNAGQFVDIIDCLRGVWAMWIGGERFNAVEHSRRRGDSIERVEGLTIGGSIKEECVHVLVSDMRLERYAP